MTGAGHPGSSPSLAAALSAGDATEVSGLRHVLMSGDTEDVFPSAAGEPVPSECQERRII